MTLADFNADTGTLIIRGKRNKERELPVHNGALDALNDWLVIRGTEPGPIFTPINKGGVVMIRQMHSEAIFNLLAKRAAEAGVKDLLRPMIFAALS